MLKGHVWTIPHLRVAFLLIVDISFSLFIYPLGFKKCSLHCTLSVLKLVMFILFRMFLVVSTEMNISKIFLHWH